MTKEEFLDKLKKLDLPPEEFVILSGGSLLMRGLREQTADLDISVSKALARQIGLYDCPKEEAGLFVPYKNVQMKDDMETFQFDVIDGYQCEALEDILRQKLQWGRPKDLADIETIRKHLKDNENIS